MNPPSLLVKLLGNVPAFLVILLISGVVFFQSLLSLPSWEGFWGSVIGYTVAVGELRLRARLTEYNTFAANWQRVGGNAAPPKRIDFVTSFLWVSLAAGAGAFVAAAQMTPPNAETLPPAAKTVVFLSVGLMLLGAGGGLYRLIIRPWRNARQRKLAQGQQLDGKALPGTLVTVALGVPRSSPGTAAFTRALPAYCQPLLTASARAVGSGSADHDDDAITTAPTVKRGSPLPDLFEKFRQWRPPQWVPVAAAVAVAAIFVGPKLVSGLDRVTAGNAQARKEPAAQIAKQTPASPQKAEPKVVEAVQPVPKYENEDKSQTAKAAPEKELPKIIEDIQLFDKYAFTDTETVLAKARADDAEALFELGKRAEAWAETKATTEEEKRDSLIMAKSSYRKAAANGHKRAEKRLAELSPQSVEAVPKVAQQARPTPAKSASQIAEPVPHVSPSASAVAPEPVRRIVVPAV